MSIVGSLREKEIEDSAIVAYTLVTRPFSTVFFLFRYYLPVSLSALGFFVGSAYVALNFASALITMLIGIVYGRLKVRKVDLDFDLQKNRHKNRGNVIRMSLNSAFRITKKVVLRYVVVTVIVTILVISGIFDLISNSVDIYARHLGFSSNFAVLVSIYVLSPLSATLTAGEFLRNGLIGAKECLIALLVGRLLFISLMDYPRHSFPFYASIFPVKLATKLVFTGIIVSVITTPLLIALISLTF